MDESHSLATFGGRLAVEMERRGMSLVELGKGMGTGGKDLQRAAIWAWTHNRTSPNVDQLRLICDRLGVTPGYMLYGSINLADLNGWEGQLLHLFRKLPADRQHELVHDLNVESDRLAPLSTPSPVSPFPAAPAPSAASKRKTKERQS